MAIPDNNEIIKKLLLKPVDWITLTPFLTGVTVLLMSWALNAQSGLVTGGSISLMLASAGIYLQRLIFGWHDNQERLVEELQQKAELAREQALDNLYQDLVKDGDPRTETILKDLRVLIKAIEENEKDAIEKNMGDISYNIDVLIKKCLDYLSESYRLWDTASKMQNKTIKQQLLTQREVVIKEVEESLENFGTILGRLRQTALSGDGQQLADLREELTSRLRIAEEIDEKMKSMRHGKLTQEDHEKFLKASETYDESKESENQNQ